MKRVALIFIAAVVGMISSCNKEKRVMEGLIGNWSIDESRIAKIRPDGTDSLIEETSNSGTLVIYEDPNGESDTSKLYDLTFISSLGDTLKAADTLFTDPDNKRIILNNAISDSLGSYNLVWTVQKSKNNRQEWAIYGVDSTFFFPANNHNPGDAGNWLKWELKLKREGSGGSGSGFF
jgi:hypothetical protein